MTKNYIKFVPSKLLNTLKCITLPKDITIDKCVQFTDLIIRNQMRYGVDDDCTIKYESNGVTTYIMGVEIASALGKLSIGNDYRKVVDFMINNYLLIADGKYSKNAGKCIYYAIHPEQRDNKVGELVEYEIKEVTLNKHTKNAIDSAIEDIKRKPKKGIPVSSEMIENIKNMKYDDVSALDWLTYIYDNKIPVKGNIITAEKMLIIEAKIKNLKLGNREPDKYRYIKRNSTNGRVDTDITTLDGNFKRFIIGNDLHVIDGKCSQPTLLLVLRDFIKNPLMYGGLFNHIETYLKNKIFVNNNEKNISRYVSGEVGKILEAFQKVKIPTDIQISDFKSVLQNENRKDFYYTAVEYIINNKPKTYIDKVFREGVDQRTVIKSKIIIELYDTKTPDVISCCFPEIGKFIGDIKKSLIELADNNQQTNKKCKYFPIVMQLIESYIWIDKIVPKLAANSIQFYTVHDSVIVAGKHKEKVEEIIRDVFKEFGLDPIRLDTKSNNIIEEFKKSKDIKKIGFEI